MIYITYQKILDHVPCTNGWAKLLLAKNVIDQDTFNEWIDNCENNMAGIELPKEPFPLSDILETNGFDDTVWALRCIDDQSLVRKFAVWCAYQVEHLMTNQHSKDALRVAWAYSEGNATEEELRDARDAAWDAARAAAWYAARDAAKELQQQKLKEILDTGECPCPWEESC